MDLIKKQSERTNLTAKKAYVHKIVKTVKSPRTKGITTKAGNVNTSTMHRNILSAKFNMLSSVMSQIAFENYS